MMLHQVSRSPRPKSLLVGDAGEREPAGKMVPQSSEECVGHNRGRGASLHVRRAAAVDAPPYDLRTPGILGPALACVCDRTVVDMNVEEKIASGASAIEGGDAVRHIRLRRDHTVIEA